MMNQFNGTISNIIPNNLDVKTEQNNNFSYYHEYCRLYLANVVLTSQMKQLMNERAELILRMSKIDRKTQQIENGGANSEDRKKRKRRTAGQIQRHYRCVVETCDKSYGSEGSLNQHIKLKHYEIYETMPQIHSNCKSQCSEQEQYVSESELSIRKKMR